MQPEWYFLFAYAILQSIPNKLGGMIALFVSVMILIFLPIMKKSMPSTSFYPINKTLFWIFFSISIFLTWIGARSVEDRYIFVGQILTISYFLYFPVNLFVFKIRDSMLKL